MKTSVEISDALLSEVRKLAAAEGTSVRALIEEGLRAVVSSRHRRKGFRLRKVTFRGNGLQVGVVDSWEHMRSLAYEGRGN